MAVSDLGTVIPKLTFPSNYQLAFEINGLSVFTGSQALNSQAVLGSANGATLSNLEAEVTARAAGFDSIKKRLKANSITLVELMAPLEYSDLAAKRAECAKEQADGKIMGSAACE